RCGDPAGAKRWLKLCAGSPVAEWIQAKLLMRAGKLDHAEVMLARCAPGFAASFGTNDSPPSCLAENLFICHWRENTPAGQQISGELGVLRLARGEYTEALDSFLRGGFWIDAAYVGERVLTVDE